MRNLLALAAAAVVVFAAVGWYLGWYKLESTVDADGHKNININLNTPQITKDIKKAEEELAKKLARDGQQPSNSGSQAPVTVRPASDTNPVPPPVAPGTLPPVDQTEFRSTPPPLPGPYNQ